MDDFSQEDLEIIAKSPLNLNHLQDLVRDAEKAYRSYLISNDGAVHNPEGICQKAILKLLHALLGGETPYSLCSNIGDRTVAAEISFLHGYIQQGYFRYEDYRALSHLVLRRASDVDIWKAITDVVDYTRVTLLPNKDAHITYSSASQQNSVLERKIVKELRRCTYRDVDGLGFWTGGSASKISKFLSEEEGRYYSTTKPNDLVGAESRRQIVMLLKQKNGKLPNTAHDWRHVDVVGEIKESDNDKNRTLLHICQYVREVFSSQPTRLFVHAFIICGRDMEVWVFDRSGCYSHGAFYIHKEPKRFIQVIAGYAMMNEKELGLDAYIDRNGENHFILLEQDGTEDRKKLWLQPDAFTRRRAIVSRGTSCYLTKASKADNWDSVTKFSWTSDKRKPEIDLLKLAHSRGVEGVATLIGHHRITSIKEMRSGLTFRKPRSSQASVNAASSESLALTKPQSASINRLRKRKLEGVGGQPSKRLRPGSQKFSQGQDDVADSNESYENRIFRCLVISPAGRAIYMFENKLELLGALRDAIKAHRSLYVNGNILHRDVSENNIIITDPKKTGFMGMLIDLDLAEEAGCSSAHCRTGTLQSMAYEVHFGEDHTYRYDLESFFYVLIWQCVRRSWGDKWPIHSQLMRWCNGGHEQIAYAKFASITMPQRFKLLLGEFMPDFGCLKSLCRELRDILFPIREGGVCTDTPEDPDTLYKPIIEAFDNAIESIQSEEEYAPA